MSRQKEGDLSADRVVKQRLDCATRFYRLPIFVKIRRFFCSCAIGIFCLLIINPGQTAEGDPFHKGLTKRSLTARVFPVSDNHRKNPRVAIIIDDFGLNLSIANSFLDLEIPVSFSILPQLTYSKKIAELAHSKNRNVLFHIPMEPHQYPQIDPGAYSLLSSMSPTTLKKTLIAGLESIPHAIGANNHMGSKLTENVEAMRLVLDYLKKQDLFFVDSVTSPYSKAFRVARKMGLRTAKRNVFLDNRREKAFIARQFRKLKKSALSRGRSIGIGHPNYKTLAVLKEIIPRFQASGIRFVSVSELVR